MSNLTKLADAYGQCMAMNDYKRNGMDHPCTQWHQDAVEYLRSDDGEIFKRTTGGNVEAYPTHLVK